MIISRQWIFDMDHYGLLYSRVFIGRQELVIDFLLYFILQRFAHKHSDNGIETFLHIIIRAFYSFQVNAPT